MLGLPDHITTCLFDLDGVLTDTASVHKKAWKAMFDEFLASYDPKQEPFDIAGDYLTYVDGKPREHGVRDFLASRGIELPLGERTDAPGTQTIWGLGNLKNDAVLEAIERDGVEVYEGSRRYLQAAADAGLRRVVVSSSANTKTVLEVTGLASLIEDRVDGVTLAEEGIAGKPAPDSFLAAAQRIGAQPHQAVVFEDAISGVKAGAAGKFGYVVGVDRAGHASALADAGANVVVEDLAELLDERAHSGQPEAEVRR